MRGAMMYKHNANLLPSSSTHLSSSSSSSSSLYRHHFPADDDGSVIHNNIVASRSAPFVTAQADLGRTTQMAAAEAGLNSPEKAMETETRQLESQQQQQQQHMKALAAGYQVSQETLSSQWREIILSIGKLHR